MRIRIAHETTFVFETPVRFTIMNVRLTPRSFDSQYVLRWRVGVDLDCAMRQTQDSLGNIVNAFSYQKPVERFTLSASGEIETNDAIGVVRGSAEPLPPQMFLRDSEKALATAKLREWVSAPLAEAADPLDRLHRLMQWLHDEIAFDENSPDSLRGAAETISLKRGSRADIAHVFIATARAYEIPARFVSGFVAPEPGEASSKLDFWAEAYTPGLGWVAFDCVRNLCANERYVRVAVGFDSASAQPIRASHSGGGTANIETSAHINGVAVGAPPQQSQMQRMS